MLRQLARLARPVPAAGPRAVALAVYAGAADRPVAARDSAPEGVACVDDAARGLVLFARLALRTGDAALRRRALGLADFLRYMQLEDGRFLNFVLDWSGRRNREGATSRPDGLFWNARAIHGLAAARPLGDDSVAAALARALAAFPDGELAGDIRAIHVLAALELAAQGCDDPRLERWCDEIAACRSGDTLLDARPVPWPHLWAHAQEAALASAGAALGRDDLVEVARRSAEAIVVPAVERAFAAATTTPDEVASAVQALTALAAATRDPRYTRLAADARAWFDGRNAAGVPVYDRRRGRIADGIDRGVVSANSGAESNVVAALALFDDVVAGLSAAATTRARSARPRRRRTRARTTPDRPTARG